MLPDKGRLTAIQTGALINLGHHGGRQWHCYHANTWASLVRRGLVVVNQTMNEPPHKLTEAGWAEVGRAS